MSGRTSKTERFQTLLQHIQTPDHLLTKALSSGQIDKLQLIKNEHKWIFHFVFQELISAEEAQFLMSKLPPTFEGIANCEIRFRFANEVTAEHLFKTYWPVFLSVHRDQLNGLHTRLETSPPVWQDGEVCLTVLNEVEKQLCVKKIEPLLTAFIQQFIPSFKATFQYVKSGEAAAVHEFREALDKEDEERVQQTLQELEQARQQDQSRNKQNGLNKGVSASQIVGRPIKEEPVLLETIREEERTICVQGYVLKAEVRVLKSGRHLLMFDVTDYSDSISVKMFSGDKNDASAFSIVRQGIWVKVRGSVQMDTFQRELVLMAADIQMIEVAEREDTAEQKRVELHVHTKMSVMDGVSTISDYVEQAAKWGHPAIAVTDHGVVQAFPEAYKAGKEHGVKIIYGMEAYLVDDGVPITYEPQKRLLADETYVIFDVETTGLSAVHNQIIELGAVKMKGGEEIDRFQFFANPHERLSEQIVQLTGITDDMLEDAPELHTVLEKFLDFIGDHTLVAHNASFDMGFMHAAYKKMGVLIQNPVLDTLELARFLYPEMKNHRLDTLCRKLQVRLDNHHRAAADALATGQMLWKMLPDVADKKITYLDELNERRGKGSVHHSRPFHGMIIAQNAVGLKNLYKLVSLSHVDYFHRVPRIPRSVLQQYRDGLLIGSGCEQGEVFQALMQKSAGEAEKKALFYDYLEIQPVFNYEHLLERELVKDQAHIQTLLQQIVELGAKLDKPVVATGNVHYLKPNDAVHRQILVTALGGATFLRPDRLPPVHLRTTDEMLTEFQFLGEEKAREVVIEQPVHLASLTEEIMPVPDKLYTPKIEGADEEIRSMCYTKARQLYGDPLPGIVEARLKKELDSIISNGFAVIYLISQKLVQKSLNDGYLVGSRGSVGSSFVATMTGITEVNPLPPHYACPTCQYVQFFEDGSVGSGFDLDDELCPKCATPLTKDGHDIPFETFLGFEGDKVPDIDLNFSGDYQPLAHKYTQELFGADYVYRAGTIGTIADKTAYGFVKKYEEENGHLYRQAEINRLASGCTGVKRTTGQHPGGIIVVPEDKDIFDFTPIQFPADDAGSEWRTTHFDFHSIHDNLLKLDILGHDDPTVIRMLQDLSGIDPNTIPIADPEVMKLFSGTEVLGVTEEQIMSKTGTLGIPEFGTRFVRQMLEATRPTTFAELVRISGLSHGTDVWLNNAQQLIEEKKAVLSEVISTRDDIMVYLIHQGLEPSRAFQIMEKVRKGRGVEEEEAAYMQEHGVPDWYIKSCQQIKYMFPKAHAVAYVLMAVRIAYFKVHYPLYFYATYFTVRADDFDVTVALTGSQGVRRKIEEINQKGNQALPKEKSLQTILELCLEMLERGFRFYKTDLYASDATKFIIQEDGLLPPLNAIPGVGTNAAANIVKARKDGEFLSVEDVRTRSKVTKTVIEALEEQGCLADLPETNQLSLF